MPHEEPPMSRLSHGSDWTGDDHELERRTVISDFLECEATSPTPIPGCRVALDFMNPVGEYEIELCVECDAASFTRLAIDVEYDGGVRRRIIDTGDFKSIVTTRAVLRPRPSAIVHAMWCVTPDLHRTAYEDSANDLFGRGTEKVRQTISARKAELTVKCVKLLAEDGAQ
jgi:hypothetical protein